MRGEICIGFGALLSLTSLLCLIFMHVGQINSSNVPRKISMINVNTSAYGQAIAAAIFPDPVNGLYATNSSAPLGEQQGLRQLYKFGLYSHCGYVNGTQGVCSNTTGASRFTPYDVITSDMLANYTRISNALVTQTTFTDTSYLGNFTNAAYYLLTIGTVCAFLALIVGLMKHTVGFLGSTIFAIVGSFMLLIGATIWTVIIKKAQSVNDIMVGQPGNMVSLGIEVSIGNGLYLAWAGFGTLIASIIPYMISCCTYRG